MSAGQPSARAQDGGGGLLAALAAYAYLWRCHRVGARARTLGRPLLVNAGCIEIGDDAFIDSRAGKVELACHGRGRIVLGHGVHVGPATRITATHLVEIGDLTRIGAGCVISDSDGSSGDGAEVWIGDGVTLGDGVRVLPGTTIGAGAVVPAGGVVSGRVPSAAPALRAVPRE
jgi:acetyltransferase-like isoleucine patch superfamily enzyme